MAIDIQTVLEVRIDTYKRQADRYRKQAIADDECGYSGSYQFNKGQQLAMETIAGDLEEILERIKEGEIVYERC